MNKGIIDYWVVICLSMGNYWRKVLYKCENDKCYDFFMWVGLLGILETSNLKFIFNV